LRDDGSGGRKERGHRKACTQANKRKHRVEEEQKILGGLRLRVRVAEKHVAEMTWQKNVLVVSCTEWPTLCRGSSDEQKASMAK
jgi:hypothetical protein